jgi:hypothetical protein
LSVVGGYTGNFIGYFLEGRSSSDENFIVANLTAVVTDGIVKIFALGFRHESIVAVDIDAWGDFKAMHDSASEVVILASYGVVD